MNRNIRHTIAAIVLATATSAQAQDPLIQGLINEVNIDSLMYNASAISGEFAVGINGTASTITSRNKLNAGNALAADYLQQRLQQLGLNTTVQTFGAAGENVLATYPGLLYPNQKVILCGHYDSMPTGNTSPAADDDGSGTASVLEAARVLTEGQQYAYTIVFALWDEEEYGLTGSAYYATQALAAEDSIIAVINMDAIAYDGDGDNKARVHTKPIAQSMQISDLAVYMNTAYGINLDLQVNNPGATYSDHASFWTKGYSAVLMIEDFDNDGNPHYHTTTDRVQYFDQGYFHRIARLSIGMAASLAIPYSIVEGIDEQHQMVQMWPNPASDVLHINLTEEPTSNTRIMLTDVAGRQMLIHQPKEKRAIISLDGLPDGLYTLTVSGKHGNHSRRLAVVR
jgi:hypothetical protein